MFKIGEFSQLCKVPVKTLRYYADINLLPPARVDKFTNYRYYTVDQLPRLNRILTLRDLGFSLDHIGQMLDDHLTAEQMRGMLRLRQAEVEQQIDDERDRLARIERRLKHIETEGNMTDYDVILKKIDATRVAALRDTVPGYAEIGRLFEELFAHLGMNGARPAGPPSAIYHDLEYKEADVELEIIVPLGGDLPETARIRVREESAIEEAATCLMQGSYDNFGQAYEALMRWIETNGYQLAGPPREVYLRGPESTQNEDEYLTEIQVPVEKDA